MRSRLLIAALVVLALLGALRMAGDLSYWQRWMAARIGTDAARAAKLTQPRLLVAGELAPLARATPQGERVAPEALAMAESEARRIGMQALVVHRHGHRVFEYFEPPAAGEMLLAGGELSALPFALSLGALVEVGRVDAAEALRVIRDSVMNEAVPVNPWSRETRRRLGLGPAPGILLQDAEGSVADTLSQRVWMPLRAGDAWLWGSDQAALRVDCCMVARFDDWMRLGDLLLGQGSYRGERIVAADWVRTLLDVDRDDRRRPVWLVRQASWEGDEPPLARDTFWFDLGSDLRLWLMPQRGLAVMMQGHGVRDTLVPNIILRGLLDQLPAEGVSGPAGMVPGH